MGTIAISELELFVRVGVPDQERAQPQRLLLTVEMACDFTVAAATDDLTRTIDYHAVTRRLIKFCEGRSWKLIESLAAEIAGMVLEEFAPASVTVEIKKFILPECRFVSVRLTRKGP